ncbi:P270 surface immunogen-like, partial [Trichomonas vaginalis G3]
LEAKVDNLTDTINTTGYKYTAEQPIKLSFNAVAAVNATEASPKYKLGNSEPVNATLTQKEGNLYEFTITAPSDISEDSKVNITVSITDPAGQTANSSELQISLGKSPYLSAPTVVAENHTEPFKAGEYIPVKVTFQHFEAKTGSFQYRFYTDQEWIDLPDDNVTEVETPSAIKKLHADEGKKYLLNIPAPKYEDIKKDGTVKLQIRLARSNDQAQSNIIETEVSLQKQQYVAPTPENSGLTGGQKAGIVIGVLLAVIIIILIIYFVFRRKPSKVKSSSDIQDDSGSGVNV